MSRFLTILLLLNAWGAPPVAAQPCWDYTGVEWPAAGTLLGPGPLQAVALTDDGRLLGAFAEGVAIYDLADPAAPFLVHFLGTDAPVKELAAAGDRVLALTDADVLWYGVLTPGQPPAWSDTLGVGAPVDRVSLDRDIAALVVAGELLQIVDVGDPKALRLAGSVVPPSRLYDIVADRGMVYVGSQYDGFYIYDATDPDRPQLRGDSGIVLMTGNALAYRYPILYVGNYNNVWPFDVSVPAAPVRLGTSDTVGPFMLRIAVSKDRLYGVSDSRQLIMYRIGAPGEMLLLGHAPLPTQARALAARDNHVYTAAVAGGGIVHDLRDASHPPFSQQSFGRRLRVQDFRGDRAYIISDDASGSGQLEILAVSAADTLIPLGTLPIFGRAVAIQATDDLVLFSTDATDLTSVDVTDPAAPRYLGISGTQSVARGLLVVGDAAYVASNTLGLVGYDISDPTRIGVSGAITLPRTQQAWSRMGHHGLVGMRGDLNGLFVVDCQDPRTMRVVAWISIAAPVWDVLGAGDRAYVADDVGGVHVIDLSHPNVPRLLTTITVGEGRGRLAAYGRNVFYVDRVQGVVVLDAPSDAWPVAVGASLVPLSWSDVFAVDSGIFLPDNLVNAVARLPLPCGALAAAPPPTVPETPGLAAWPNPFNPRTTLGFRVAVPGPVDLTIHDLRGRRVRSLAAGRHYDSGAQELSWDGRDDAGRGLPSGVYLARLVAAGATATTRLVLVR